MTAVKSYLESLAGVNHVEIDMEEYEVAVSYDPDMAGPRVYVGSYHTLRRKSAYMDVLVAIGTNTAYFYSVCTVIKASFSDGFEEQTSDALSNLTDLTPDTACLLTMGDDKNVISETEISTQLIQRNNNLRIFSGSKFPVDGIVIDGHGYVNESMITGEVVPVAKNPGDKVIGGTVNDNGCLLIKATHIGSETALSQIVQIFEAAQLARAPVQKLADRISRFFVPVYLERVTTKIAVALTELGNYNHVHQVNLKNQ
ncbi:Cation-transporting P-type ATPase [Cynara cardunculus var. scolymus]|uniref:Cation-transporting P-type ATPase n=1 Tax=Cynara cardunculus var. scolymus TaxID=59895 RepID=A0A103XJY1_CYNCS|nr:Cation-transporting P-type ATPase [Cynara cardunculus var. scolymus]